MKIWIKRCGSSFGISAICGLLVNMLIEIIVRIVGNDDSFIPLAPEFVALFPSETIAMEVNILLYGVIGAAFSAAAWVYEQEKLGFVLQSIFYFLLTSIVWIPIVILVWQLQKYPQALISTLAGFAGTYAIMSVVGYRITKSDVDRINRVLEQKSL